MEKVLADTFSLLYEFYTYLLSHTAAEVARCCIPNRYRKVSKELRGYRAKISHAREEPDTSFVFIFAQKSNSIPDEGER